MDDFYAMLCSEELNIVVDISREVNTQTNLTPQFSLTTRGHGQGRSYPKNNARG